MPGLLTAKLVTVQVTVIVTAVYAGLLLPLVGVKTTVTTHGLLAMTLPTVGAISILVLLDFVVIQFGKATSPVRFTVVKAPVVGQLLAEQALIAGVAL